MRDLRERWDAYRQLPRRPTLDETFGPAKLIPYTERNPINPDHEYLLKQPSWSKHRDN